MDQNSQQGATGTNMLAYADARVASGGQPQEPDAEIALAVARGDYRHAIECCANRHGAALGRLCMAMVGSQAEAQELAQETLLAAQGGFGSYRAEGTIRAFLFGIARRVCAHHIEVRARREARLRLVHDAARDGTDSAELLAIRQRAERTRSALDRLRPTEREAVVLRYQAGLSFREVADACGIDEAAARKRVSRAIARLRESLGDL
jgi:RNA polymerase sigma-70 factor, ECF subfamily